MVIKDERSQLINGDNIAHKIEIYIPNFDFGSVKQSKPNAEVHDEPPTVPNGTSLPSIEYSNF